MQSAGKQLQVIFLGEANRTMNRMRKLRDHQSRLAAACLGDGHTQSVSRDAVTTATELSRHAGGKHMLAHDCQLMLDRLELPDSTPKLLTLVRILQAALEHVTHGPCHLRGHHGGLQAPGIELRPLPDDAGGPQLLWRPGQRRVQRHSVWRKPSL